MTSVPDAKVDWGRLSEPLREAVPDGMPPWRDNAYLAFCDLRLELFGVMHVSTSPNAEGRRARFSLVVDGVSEEVVESLEPGSFVSESIEFDLGASIRVHSPRIEAELTMTPLFGVADYTEGKIIPSLVEDEPLNHLQQAARVTGRVAIGGRELEIDAEGIRDRTWGYRDESANISEYFAVVTVLPDRALTAMRFKGLENDITEGYLLRADGSNVAVAGLSVTRDASGLFSASTVRFADGGEMTLSSQRRLGGFWVPMGWERTGPTMSVYDECCVLRSEDGAEGFGLVEQGVLRQIY